MYQSHLPYLLHTEPSSFFTLLTKMDADYYSSAIALLENAAAEFKRSVDKQIVAFENEQKLHEETMRSIDG